MKEAVEVSGGYDTNPGRFAQPQGSAFYRIAPELQATSDWTRHALNLDLRGSFTGYGTTFPADAGNSSVPVNIDRPDVDGKLTGRIDVTRDTRIISALRLRVGTDNPTTPNPCGPCSSAAHSPTTILTTTGTTTPLTPRARDPTTSQR